MNKKEVLEIRKQFTPENCAITRICACYVNHEKEKILESKNAFLSLPEEECFKYFDIFKHTLSGSIGKNLTLLDFPLSQEGSGGTQEFLLKLRDSKLKDNDLLEEFYDRVIESFNFGENYYIILIHAAYDIPGKTSDGFGMEDASDEVYEYLLCSICPVGLSKAGLSYDTEKNVIADRLRDWVVDMPMNGFLFPAFTDRSTDIHQVLFYTKKTKNMQEAFIDSMFGTQIPMSAEMQKDAFYSIVSDVLGSDCNYETVKNIHAKVYEKIEEAKESPEPLEFGKEDLKKVFESCEVPAECMDNFESAYNKAIPDKSVLVAENITDVKKFSIQTPDVIIKVNPEREDLIKTKVIDGKVYFMIPAEGNVEVNGMGVRV